MDIPQFLQQPLDMQLSPTVIFIISGGLGILIAVIASITDLIWFRVGILVTLGMVMLALAFNVEWISPAVESDSWLENVFLNLSTELFGALLFLTAFNFWKKHRRLNLLDLLIIGFLMWVAWQLHEAAADPQLKGEKIWLMRGLAQNLSLEILSTLIIQLGVVVMVQGVTGGGLPALTLVTGILFVAIMLILTMVMMVVLLFDRALPPDLYERLTLFTAITGAFITTVLFGNMPHVQSTAFVLICVTTIGIASLILFEVTSISTDLSINFSTELFGALIATVLLENGDE